MVARCFILSALLVYIFVDLNEAKEYALHKELSKIKEEVQKRNALPVEIAEFKQSIDKLVSDPKMTDAERARVLEIGKALLEYKTDQ
ncbi:hypothetical protein N826_25495 [Skermanella aerolata KACC 11604]|nr:hypothetical protein N826_25495 [Skermanella aerolata KACC 11604]